MAKTIHSTPVQVILYTRPGCHLCEDAEDLLDRLGQELPLQVTLVNILSEPEIYERYKWSIPVIVVEGGPGLSAPIDEGRLRAALGLPR